MNKAHLVSHVAAETSTTGAAAERMAGAVRSAIADTLARDEPVAAMVRLREVRRPRPRRASGTQSANRGAGRRPSRRCRRSSR